MDIENHGSVDLTVLDSIGNFNAQGYVAQFAAIEDAAIRCFACHSNAPATAFVIDALERSEGQSDPDDMVVTMAIRCPSCEAKGLLTLKYGPEATFEEQQVFLVLDDRRNDTASGGTRAH